MQKHGERRPLRPRMAPRRLAARLSLLALSLLAPLVLAACAGQGSGAPAAFLAQMGSISDPVPEAFTLCVDHECQNVRGVTLTPAQWAGVERLFVPAPATAEQERERIAFAIGMLEVLTGPQIGTTDERGGSFNFLEEGPQFDCYDEATNATAYLMMLNAAGLIRHHRIGGPVLRGWFVFGWPHQAASIWSRDDGTLYAVDSWHFDNGTPALVVPFDRWVAAGWSPGPPPARLTAAALGLPWPGIHRDNGKTRPVAFSGEP